LGIFTGINAQNTNVKEKVKPKDINKVKTQENQGQEVKKINESFHAREEEIRKNSKLTEEEKKEQLKALENERQIRLKEVSGKEIKEKKSEDKIHPEAKTKEKEKSKEKNKE
jgi:hypothetical protein